MDSFKAVKNYQEKNPNRAAALTLGVLVLISISPSFFQGRYLAPVDTTHYVAPYLDVTTQMLPWYHLSKEIILSGHFPFWNVFSGQGLPLMANMQSAVFFPLTWLFYFLNIRWALLIYSFLKLFLMGMLTYLYLRELKLSYYVCLIGGVLFAFCGANVIWFLWPLTSVILILPLSFLLLEKYFNAQSTNTVIPSDPRLSLDLESLGEPRNPLSSILPDQIKGSLRSPSDALGLGRDDTKKNLKYALWLAPVIALGLFAGHPQTFFYIFCAIYTYTIFKCLTSTSSIRLAIRQCAAISGFYFLGFLISAAAVLPFLEYLKLSANLDYRAGFTENPFFLPKLLFLANIIPDFYGNTGIKNFSYLLVPNYGEIALGYVGISGLTLSLFAFTKKVNPAPSSETLRPRGRLLNHSSPQQGVGFFGRCWIKREIVFFSAMSLVTLALIYHAPIIYWLINKLPGFSLNYNNRLLYLWAFFLIILACFGLQNLLDAKISAKRHKYTWLGFAIFSAMLIAANKIATKSWNFAHNLDWGTVSLWQNVMIAAFIANLLAAYFIIKRLPKKSALSALFTLIVMETAIHGMVFMKTSKPENFYPSEPALTFLQNQYKSGYGRVFTFGDNLLPNIGTWYGINQLNDHDTIYLRTNKKLKTLVANYNYSPEYTFNEPNLNALRFLSVKYLLYPPKEGRAMLQKHPQDLQLAFSDQNYMILALNNSLPRAYLVSSTNLDELNNLLADLAQDPNSHRILPAKNFQISEDGSEKISFGETSDNYLITADNYYPDWEANFSSGQSVKIQNAFGLRAVDLTPGQNSVTISYKPKSFKLGWEISLGAIGLWLAIYLFLRFKKIKTRSS